MGKKPPDQPAAIFKELAQDLEAALGGDLLGVTVFGSAVGGRYRKGSSDINLLVVVADHASNSLARLLPFCKKWQPARVAVPLVMSQSYISTSLDVFPIEFMAMAAENRSIHGRDFLEGLQIKPGHLRLQLERELKGKLLTLRESLLASLGKKDLLHNLARRAFPAFGALFKAYLQLTRGEFPADHAAILADMAARGHELKAVRELGRVASGQIKPGAGDMMALVEKAAGEIEAISSEVDGLAVE